MTSEAIQKQNRQVLQTRTQKESKMGIPKARHLFTVQEYLDAERGSDERHEYLDGEIIAMAGEKLPHSDISVNLVGSLHLQLKGTPCRALTKDIRVCSGPLLCAGKSKKGLYSYPDIFVVCGDPEYLDDYEDVILNPKAIFEVLSPSTEAFDRGEKCRRYQTWNPTLTDYLIVSQDEPVIEHFRRKKDGSWTFRRYSGLEAAFSISSIRCELKVADVYDRVVFEEA